MTDAGLQLDFFQRARTPRAQRMAFRDAGWQWDGKPVALFKCPKCGREKWIVCERTAWNDGPPCPKCNARK